MTYLLGLTGSIGMGKSTTARMFATVGVPGWDADAAVHRLYAPGGAAVGPIQAALPEAIDQGAVSRTALKRLIETNKSVLSALEQIVHPLLAADRAAFIEGATTPIVLFDIPLLFETQADKWLNGVAVVSTDAATQRARVLERPGMTAAQLDLILSRQMPDAEKRARADWVISTDTREGAEAAVRRIVAEITTGLTNA